ncbi:MAG: citrate synthase, partial [Lachnospiraceae bacterium]|nr:citrate synthase [Lachnospiraceae bacterium]
MKKRDGIDTSGYTKLILENDSIPQKYYEEFDVKRGLRDQNGKGVLAGLTSVSNIVARDPQGNPCDG